MKRNVSLAVLLLAWLTASGCAGGDGRDAGREATPERSEPVPANGVEEPRTPGVMAACARAVPEPEPSRAAPGGAFRVRGEGFATDCYDTGQPGLPPPQRGIRIDFRQGERTWRLATADADRRGTLDAELEVPDDAEPGSAAVVVRTDDGQPLESPFRVLGDRANQGPPETGSPEGDEPVASGVAAACAEGGAPVDLVAEGKVRRVRVGGDSSLVRLRLERVLAGDAAAGETVTVRTSSGTGVVTEHDVGFEEGARYLLRLQRRGDAYVTNICLGTERVE